MGLKLRPHQEIGLDLLAENDRFALLWDMRTGKTLPALIDATDKIISGEAENWLWIAPLSALGAVPNNARLLSPERQEAVKKITLINYDKLSRKGSKWRNEIRWTDWDGITLDEGHKIKNPKSNTTQFILGTARKHYTDGIAYGVPYKRFLSGTPVANSKLENFWAMLRFLDYEWCSYEQFCARFCVTRNIPGTYAKYIVGYRDVDALMEQVSQVSNTVRLADVTFAPDDNPDFIVNVPWSSKKNPAPFGVDTRTIYQQTMDSYIDGLDMVMDNPMSRMTRLRMIASGSVTDDEKRHYPLYNEKAKYTLDVIENFEGKVVVFHFFAGSGDDMAMELERKKIPYKRLNGRTPASEKTTVWRDFQDDPDCKVFLSQINSGGTGIDLYTADMIIFMEPCVSSVDLEQARKRIADVNATTAKSFVFMLTEDSIENDIYQRLQNHEGFTEKMFAQLMADEAVNRGTITRERADELLAEHRLDGD